MHLPAAQSLHFSHTQSSDEPAHTRSTKPSLLAYTKFRQACTYLQHKAFTSHIHKNQTSLHKPAAQSLHFSHTKSSDEPAHTCSTKPSLLAYTKIRQACTYLQHKAFTSCIHKSQMSLHLPTLQSLHFLRTQSIDKPAHTCSKKPSFLAYTKYRQACNYPQHKAFSSRIHKVQTSLHNPAAQSLHFSHTQSSDEPAHTRSTKPSLLAFTKFRRACTYPQYKAFTSRIHKVQSSQHLPPAQSLHFSHTQSSDKPAQTCSTKPSLLAYTKFRRVCT